VNDGDYSKFDKDLLKEIFELFFLFVKQLIPEDIQYEERSVHWWIDQILKCCLFSKTLTIVQGVKLLMQTLHGNPSGWFLTVFFNDFANKIYMTYAWIKLNPTLDIKTRCELFFKNVVIFFFGDDNIFSVSDQFCNQFNAFTVSNILRNDLNITYTSGDKTDEVSFNKSIWECKFLKNSFVRHYSGRIVAGLDKNTIQEMVSWTKDRDNSMEQIFNTALRYSYFWGAQYFAENRKKLLSFCDTLITYNELDYEYNSYQGINFEIYDKMESKKFENKMAKLDSVKRTMDSPIKIQSKDMTNGFRDDDATRSTMRNFGVNLVNQNIDSITKYYNKPAEINIPEAASTLKKLLSRPILVTNTTVPAGTFGSVISINMPNAWINASSSIKDIANAYFLFKGKLKMQVTLQSTPFNAGAMVAHVSYKEESSWLNSHLALDSISNAWIRPHVEMDYSDCAANKIMDIPWKYKREYCDFSALAVDSICQIYFDNYAPNTFAASLLVYIWLEDADVVVTRLGANPFLLSGRKATPAAVTTKKMLTTQRMIANRESESGPRKPIPKVMGFTLFGDTVTNVTTNQQIGSVEGNVVPNNLTGDQFDIEGKLSLSALDQPNIPIEAQNVIATREPTTSNADQVTHKEKMNLYPKEQLLADFDTFGIDEDEMSIDYLKRKWSLCPMNTGPTFTYTTSTTPYTVLSAVNVGPYGGAPTWIGAKTGAVPFSFLDYITKNHLLWRGSRSKKGSLEYRFKFCTNRFQSGRIAVAYNPVANWYDMFNTLATTGLTFSADQLGACYVAYFDINGQNNEIIVRLPYVANTPWKAIWTGSDTAVGIQSDQLKQLEASFAGVLVVLAITPMVSPVGSATSVNVIPFVRGAPGFQMAVPSNRNNYVAGSFIVSTPETATTTTTTKARVMSQDKKKIRIDCWELLRQIIRMPKVEFELPYYVEPKQDEENPKVQSDDFVFLGDDVTTKDDNYGIIPTQSLRDLCKRFSPYVTATSFLNIYRMSPTRALSIGYPAGLYRVGVMMNIPVFPSNEDTRLNNNPMNIVRPTWMYNYGSMYQGYRGSMKFRIKTSLVRGSNTPNIAYINRPFEDFHMIVVLNENLCNTSRYYNEGDRIGTVSNVFNSPISSLTRPDGTRSQDLGQILFEANFSGDIVKDIEIPLHLINKYIEMENNIEGDDITEFRPELEIMIYKNIVVKSPATTIAATAALPSILNAYQDATVNLEVLSSIGDSGRFGVLDEYGYFGILGTSVYFSDATRLRGLQDFAPILPS